MDHNAAKFYAAKIVDHMAAAFWVEHVEHYGEGGEEASAASAKRHLEGAARDAFAKLAEAMGYTIAAKALEAA